MLLCGPAARGRPAAGTSSGGGVLLLAVSPSQEAEEARGGGLGRAGWESDPRARLVFLARVYVSKFVDVVPDEFVG